MTERGAYGQTHGDVLQSSRGPAIVTRPPQKSKIAVSEKASDETPVVHILDDDELLRCALDSLFRSVGLTVRTYHSTQEFLDSDLLDSPGCLVLDIRLPGANGLDFQEALAGLGISLPVVLMTGHGDIPMCVRAMKAGAVDFLAKPFRDQDIIDAVTAAINRDRLQRLSEKQAVSVVDRYATLSPREREVMALVTAGKLNKQIAAEIGLSEVTVKIHRGAAMRKMGARSLADLVRMADVLKNRGSLETPFSKEAKQRRSIPLPQPARNVA